MYDLGHRFNIRVRISMQESGNGGSADVGEDFEASRAAVKKVMASSNIFVSSGSRAKDPLVYRNH